MARRQVSLMTDILTRKLTPSRDVAESIVGDETVLLHLVNGTYYGLDPVGTRIWRLMQKGLSLPDICCHLAGNYGVELTTFEADARKFLCDLETQGIVVEGLPSAAFKIN